MFGDKKDIQENLKDSASHLGITIKDSRISISYTKTNKLITALYMVTDMIDKEEPLRNKLRTLGTAIISDINSLSAQAGNPVNACAKISEAMSFLDIAASVNIISPMNCGILKKEFSELDRSIQGAAPNVEAPDKKIDLSEFFKDSGLTEGTPSLPHRASSHGQYKSLPALRREQVGIGHTYPTRIGVQKGSTLMKALSNTKIHSAGAENFETLKRQRREDVINIIKLIGRSATIKDIKDRVQLSPSHAGALASCGEKTLQRELVAMVKDDVLNKTGEKRWSKYYIK